MSLIHINRDRKSLGQFTFEEVLEGMAIGKFFPSDLGWTVGMETWKPLSLWESLSEGKSLSQNEGFSPVSDPHALPALHKLIEALKACSSEIEPAWERRKEIGWFQSFFFTIGSFLRRPLQTFERMPTQGDLLSPLLFLLLSTFAIAVLTLPFFPFYIRTLTEIAHALPSQSQSMAAIYSLKALTPAHIILSLSLTPIRVTVFSFVFAGLIHFVLYLTGGVHRGFESTYRVICYAWGTAAIFNILPFFGILVGMLVQCWLLIVGLQRVNQIEGWRAMLTVFFLPLCCCVCVLLTVIYMGSFSPVFPSPK